jgi:hypothetical protein
MNFLLIAAMALSLGEFKFSAPPDWQMKAVANGYDGHAASGATMRIRVYRIAGGTDDAGGKRAARNVRDAAFEAVRRQNLAEQMPPRSKSFKRGSLEESLYTTPDALGYLAVYILTGHRSVVVTTVEGSATHVKEIVPVRQAFVAALGGE